MFAVGVDVANGRSMVAVLDGMRNMVAKPFEVVHTAQGFATLLLYKSPKTEAASRGAGQLIAKVVQWKGNGLTDHPKSFALATESVSQPSIVQRSICAGRVPSGTLESANR